MLQYRHSARSIQVESTCMSTTAQTSAPARTQRRARRIVARITLIAVVGLLVVYLLISALAANILTVPRRVFGPQTPAALSLAYQDVRFPSRSDKIGIAGWY